jgi:hypothetical protein
LEIEKIGITVTPRIKSNAINTTTGIETCLVHVGATAVFLPIQVRLGSSAPNSHRRAAFVTNATNVAYVQGGTPVNGLVAANIAPPRVFGIEISYAFGPDGKARD